MCGNSDWSYLERFFILYVRFSRGNCKFIHCNGEEEEHFKITGELPVGVRNPDDRLRGYENKQQRLKPTRLSQPSRDYANGHSNGNSSGAVDIPLCKDFLKGVCDRPPGGAYY